MRNTKQTLKRGIIPALTLGMGLFLATCGSDTVVERDVATVEPTFELPQSVIKGFGISPRGFPETYEAYPAFLEEVAAFPNGAVMFNGSWRDDIEGGSDAGEVPSAAKAVVQHGEELGFVPIVVFGWRSDDGSVHISVPENIQDNWDNDEAKALFVQMLERFVENQRVPFIFLGNESDAYFSEKPEDYYRWVDFYNVAYDAVKSISPETQVGPVFQYERMAGLGNFNGWDEEQWAALEAHDFAKIDVLGLTLYPWLGVRTPEEIPEDYFTPLLERVGEMPIAITESGWPYDSLGIETPWEASPDAQVRFLAALDGVVAGTNLRILNWSFLYPLSRPEGELPDFWLAFGGIGLYDHEGEALPIYDLWKAYRR